MARRRREPLDEENIMRYPVASATTAGDTSKIDKEIVAAQAKIEKIEDERAAMNADKKSIIERLEVRGINKHALKLAFRYAKMDSKQREGFDVAYKVVRRAIGLPLQGDLFERQANGDGS
jgi:uncharacterized protein (UPF0335 family)